MAFYPLSRTGWTVTPDSTYSGYPASNATDGNNSTSWNSAEGYPHYLIVDMGSAQSFNAIQVIPRQDYPHHPTAVEAHVSDDGSTWGSAVASGTWAADTTTKKLTFTAVSKRYFRLRATAGSTTIMALAEIYAGTDDGLTGAQITQAGMSVLYAPATVNARLSQAGMSVLYAPETVNARLSQSGLMVLVDTTSIDVPVSTIELGASLQTIDERANLRADKGDSRLGWMRLGDTNLGAVGGVSPHARANAGTINIGVSGLEVIKHVTAQPGAISAGASPQSVSVTLGATFNAAVLSTRLSVESATVRADSATTVGMFQIGASLQAASATVGTGTTVVPTNLLYAGVSPQAAAWVGMPTIAQAGGTSANQMPRVRLRMFPATVTVTSDPFSLGTISVGAQVQPATATAGTGTTVAQANLLQVFPALQSATGLANVDAACGVITVAVQAQSLTLGLGATYSASTIDIGAAPQAAAVPDGVVADASTILISVGILTSDDVTATTGTIHIGAGVLRPGLLDTTRQPLIVAHERRGFLVPDELRHYMVPAPEEKSGFIVPDEQRVSKVAESL
jgi:hypothetical protein